MVFIRATLQQTREGQQIGLTRLWLEVYGHFILALAVSSALIVSGGPSLQRKSRQRTTFNPAPGAGRRGNGATRGGGGVGIGDSPRSDFSARL